MRSPRSAGASGLVITLLATAAITAPVAAQDGSTHTVAQDGSGDFDTVGAAIEAAADGDTVLISPGRYEQSLVLDKSLTLAGNGPREEIVIALEAEPERSPLYDFDYYMHERGPAPVYAEGVDLVIEGLSIEGKGDEWPSLWVRGGNLQVSDLDTDEFIAVRDGATATIEGSRFGEIGLAETGEVLIRDNEFRGGFAEAGSVGSVEDNVIVDHPFYIQSGSDFTISGNTIDNPESSGVEVLEPGSVGRIIDNDISAGWVAVLIEFPESVLVEGNTIKGGDVGVVVLESDTVVRDNDISAEREVGLYTMGDGVLVEDNTISGGRIGMQLDVQWEELPDHVVDLDQRTRIEGNSIEGASYFGVVIEGDVPAGSSGPSLEGNTICAEREPLKIVGEPDPSIGTNDICQIAED